MSLNDLVQDCLANGYTTRTEKNIPRSILYHLNVMESIQPCSPASSVTPNNVTRETLANSAQGKEVHHARGIEDLFKKLGI